MSPEASLITVTYNSRSALQEFWSGYDRSWGEWIVVDNASTDGSAELARTLGATVVVLPVNRGFAVANNVGAAQARSEALIFCNPDVAGTREGVHRLAARALESGCLVAPQLVNGDGSLQENGRGAPFPHRKLLHMVRRHGAQDDAYARPNHGDGVMEVVWAMGAALAVSRQVFDRIGGWNESYFIYYEDAEICLRALREGVPTVVDGGVRWRHGWARETAKGFSRSAWTHEARSGLRFYTTHPHVVLPVGRRGRQLLTVDRGSRDAASIPRPK